MNSGDYRKNLLLVQKPIDDYRDALEDPKLFREDMEKTLAVLKVSISRFRESRIDLLLLLDGAVAVLGAVLGSGSNKGCAIKGVFGSCTACSESDQENLKKLSE